MLAGTQVDLSEPAFLILIPIILTAVAAYLMFSFRQHLFEMVCSIGFLAGLFCFIIRPQGNVAAAIAASICRVTGERFARGDFDEPVSLL